MTITVHEAKTHFSRYLAAVEGGGEFVIARGKTPVARLVPLERVVRVSRPKVGEVMDEPFDIPRSAFASLGKKVRKVLARKNLPHPGQGPCDLSG